LASRKKRFKCNFFITKDGIQVFLAPPEGENIEIQCSVLPVWVGKKA